MYKKIIITSTLVSTLIFTGCVTPKPDEGDNNTTKAGKGTQLMSMLGGAILGATGVYITNAIKGHDKDETKKEKKARENRERNQILAGAVVGGAVGYVVGGKLADMQKRYKGEENRLISQIIDIEKESEELKRKNSNLTSELNQLDGQITTLQTDRITKAQSKADLKRDLITQLESKKAKLKSLIRRNQQLSKKILSSKSQVNKYEYKAKDKRDILKHVNILSDNSKKYEQELNSKIALINTKIRNLA